MAEEKLTGMPEADIKKAWEFYEKFTLPRRVLKDPNSTDDYRKLEPGEEAEGSATYSVWATPIDEIGDFGLGIYLYFYSLLILMGTMIICICLNIPAMQYYNSSDYPVNGVSNFQLTIGGNAVCDTVMPVCVGADSCTCEIQEVDATTLVTKEDTLWAISGTNCAMKSACTMDFSLANWDMGMLIFLVVGLFALAKVQNKIVEEADEAEQTAQDYSVLVQDPDANATSPDEWQQFFHQFGHVSYVTVAIDNGELIQTLAERRLIARMIAFETATDEEKASMFDPTENQTMFDELGDFKKKLIGAGLANDVTNMRKQILAKDEKIKELCKKEFSAKKVFVVFETEASQRACLKEMTVGIIPALLNKANNIPEAMRFRGSNILSVIEAPEPTDVIWVNLETTFKHQVIELSVTMFITILIITVLALIIWQLSGSSPTMAGFFISAANGGLPAFLKALNETEEHLTQGSRQTSLLLKLVLSRWMTAAIVIWLVRGFENTLKESFMTKAAAVLFADAFTTPVIRMMDPAGRYGRAFAAKKAKTQEKMNSFFTNTAWFLAERYTDMTKSLFVGLFYSTLYPGGLFWSLCAFFVCYWIDKYCLFRLWKQPPAIDASLTAASRLQMAVVCVIHSIIAGLFFAGYPFDSLGSTGIAATGPTVTRNLLDGSTESVNTEAAAKFQFATIEMVPTGIVNNLDFQDKAWWMSEEQKSAVKFISIVNIIIMVLVCVGYFGRSAAFSIYKLFYGEYIAVGDPNPDLFSFVTGIESYIPMFVTDKLPLPLLACDLTMFDNEHISFTADYSKLDITKDSIMQEIKESGVDISKCFSVCKQYKSPELIASENSKGI